jgi:hypothetical protein
MGGNVVAKIEEPRSGAQDDHRPSPARCRAPLRRRGACARRLRPACVSRTVRSPAAMPVDWFNRLAILVAGLLGAGGVAAAAVSTHAGGPLLQPLALVALTQAPQT